MQYSTCQRNIAARLHNHTCRVKAISITYSDCGYVALGNQHAVLMRHVILLAVACLAPYHFFFHIILKRHDFWKKEKLLNVKLVSMFSL